MFGHGFFVYFNSTINLFENYLFGEYTRISSFNPLSSFVKLIVNRSSWQAHRADPFERVLRQSPLNTEENNSLTNRFKVAVRLFSSRS